MNMEKDKMDFWVCTYTDNTVDTLTLKLIKEKKQKIITKIS